MAMRIVRLGSSRTPGEWSAFRRAYRAEMAAPESARPIELLAEAGARIV